MKMSYSDLVAKIAAILPGASFGEDNDGQIVIYTDLMQVSSKDNDPLADFDCEEE